MPDNEKRELLGRLNTWLAANGKERKDLPALLGVSFATVNGWYSKNPITSKNASAIEDLIRDVEEAKEPVLISKALLLSPEMGEEVDKLAKSLGITESEVIRKALLALADKIMNGSN